MDASILLGIIAVIFGIIPLITKSNAVYMLLALGMGEIVANLAASDVTQIAGSMIALDVPMYSIVQITLLVVAPLVLLMTQRQSTKNSQFILQLIPAAALVVLTFLLVVEKLPYDLRLAMQDDDIYKTIQPYEVFAATGGLLVSVFYLGTRKSKSDKEDKKGKK